GDRKIFGNKLGESVNSAGNLFFACGLDIQRRTTVVLQIQKGCVDAYLVAEPGVLARHDSISTAELRDATNHRGINGSPGSDPQIGKHLMQAVGRNGAELRRLASVVREPFH